MTAKPVLLDRYCGGGGAARGYQRAGFYVVGVDSSPQPHYAGDEFHQGDALDDAWLKTLGPFDAQHGSPPCKPHSRMGRNRAAHADLIPATRQSFAAWGIPYVIENVEGAPLRPDLKICACRFGPSELKRVRWFETWPVLPDLRPPCYHPGPIVSITRSGGRRGRGNEYVSLARCRELMGISWLSRRELGDAIPPDYTELIGTLLMWIIRKG